MFSVLALLHLRSLSPSFHFDESAAMLAMSIWNSEWRTLLITKLSRSGSTNRAPHERDKDVHRWTRTLWLRGHASQVDAVLEGNIQRADDRLRASFALCEYAMGPVDGRTATTQGLWMSFKWKTPFQNE